MPKSKTPPDSSTPADPQPSETPATTPAKTPTPTPPNPRNGLKTAADRANTLHAEIEVHDCDDFTKAMEIGKILTPIRANLKTGKKGKWMAWQKENLKFSDTTARTYIKIAECSKKKWFKNVVSLSEARLVIRKNIPGNRQKQNEKETAKAVTFEPKSSDAITSTISSLNVEKKDSVASILVSAQNQTQLASLLKFAMKKHGGKLVEGRVAVIIIKIETPVAK